MPLRIRVHLPSAGVAAAASVVVDRLAGAALPLRQGDLPHLPVQNSLRVGRTAPSRGEEAKGTEAYL